MTFPRMPGMALWPAFTLLAPGDQPVLADRQTPSMSYPPGHYRWGATVVFQFVVDTGGRVVPETVRDVPPRGGLVFHSSEERAAYDAFVRHTKDILTEWRFKPAVSVGCRVRQLVQEACKFHH
jgi:hypothetical protein